MALDERGTAINLVVSLRICCCAVMVIHRKSWGTANHVVLKLYGDIRHLCTELAGVAIGDCRLWHLAAQICLAGDGLVALLTHLAVWQTTS